MEKPANGAGCHIEIPADDVGRAKAFREVLGVDVRTAERRLHAWLREVRR